MKSTNHYKEEISDLCSIGRAIGYKISTEELEMSGTVETVCIWGEDYVFRPDFGVFNPMTNLERGEVGEVLDRSEYVITKENREDNTKSISASKIDSVKGLCDVVNPSVKVIKSILEGNEPYVYLDSKDTTEEVEVKANIDIKSIKSYPRSNILRSTCSDLDYIDHKKGNIYYKGNPHEVADEFMENILKNIENNIENISKKSWYDIADILEDIAYKDTEGKYKLNDDLNYNTLDKHLRYLIIYYDSFVYKNFSTLHSKDESEDLHSNFKGVYLRNLMKQIDSVRFEDNKFYHKEGFQETAKEVIEYLDDNILTNEDYPLEGKNGKKLYDKDGGKYLYNQKLKGDFFEHIEHAVENIEDERLSKNIVINTDSGFPSQSHKTEDYPEALIEEISVLYDMLGWPPSEKIVENYSKLDSRLINSVENLSYAIESVCGKPILDDAPKHTDFEILKEIDEIENQVDGELTTTKFRNNSNMNLSRVTRFDSLDKAKRIVHRANSNVTTKSAKESVGERSEAKGKRGTSGAEFVDEEIVAAVEDVAEQIGESPSISQYSEHKSEEMPGVKYIKRHKGWNNALKQSGLSIWSKKGRKYSDNEIIDAVEKVSKKVNDSISMKEYDELRDEYMPSSQTVNERIGWSDVQDRISSKHKEQNISREECIFAVMQVREDLGEFPTESQYEEARDKSQPDCQTVVSTCAQESQDWDEVRRKILLDAFEQE